MTHFETAISFAVTAHAGQTDKQGQPYILHPLRVMQAVLRRTGDPTLAAAAVLHDVVEDTHYTVEDIRSIWGDRIADAVDGVSRREGETYMDFVRRAAAHPDSREIKLEDVLDNSTRAGAPEGLLKRYRKALAVLRG